MHYNYKSQLKLKVNENFQIKKSMNAHYLLTQIIG